MSIQFWLKYVLLKYMCVISTLFLKHAKVYFFFISDGWKDFIYFHRGNWSSCFKAEIMSGNVNVSDGNEWPSCSNNTSEFSIVWSNSRYPNTAPVKDKAFPFNLKHPDYMTTSTAWVL